jgi:cell wall-associated NlpC family hydrolase
MTAASPRPQTRTALVALTTISLTGFGLVSLSGPASADPGLDQVRDRVESVGERVDDLYHQAEVVNERLLAAKVDHQEAAKALQASKKAVRAQDAELTDTTTQMGGFAAAAYRQGIVEPTLYLVLSDDPTNALDESMMLDSYAASQASDLAQAAAKRQALLVKQADIEEQEATLAALEQTIAEERASLDSKVDQAEALLASLEGKEQRLLERLEAQRAERAAEQAARAASREAPAPAESASDTPEAPAAAPASGRGRAAVAFALGQIGDYYAYGGTGPSAWDCSGLTGGAWAAAGVSVPRTSQAQFYGLPRVSMDALQPGDIIGYYGGVSHVGLYIGNGQIVHASRPGRPVAIAPLYSMPVAGAVRPG